MNLSKLFEEQRKLDERIIKEHGLEDMDRLPYLILALQVELGECANEWRGFKYWSKDREPRKEKKIGCKVCNGTSYVTTVSMGSITNMVCSHCNGSGWKFSNPLLEEYVDCLHFILSIGLVLEIPEEWELELEEPLYSETNDITTQFIHLTKVAELEYIVKESGSENMWWELIEQFVCLGEMLGFAWEQIEQAYYAKNQINHKRQMEGY